jgi:hypothetical protein
MKQKIFSSFARPLARMSATALLMGLGVVAQAATWVVQPNCKGVSRCFPHPQALYNWSAIAPGDVVQIAPDAAGTGWTSRVGGAAALSIDLARGTAAKHITVTAVGGAKLLQGVNVSRSQYVDLIGLDVSENRSGGNAAVTLQAASADITVQASRIHNGASHGVNVTSTAGPRIRIGPDNGIYDNQNNGVNIEASGADPAQAAATIGSEVFRNVISANGLHGVDVVASYWRVAQNQVLVNGLRAGGSSGIHLFSRIDQAGADCDGNEVSYNHVSGQRDSTLYDGNGIQSDHFCDNNVIAFNVVWANAGAGISLIAGRSNIVAMNTLYNNATDQNRASTPALRGELIVASWADFCWNGYIDAASCKLPAGRSNGNLIFDNLIHSNQARVPALLLNAEAVNASRGNTQAIYPNLLFNSVGGPNLRWNERAYTNAADIDRITGLSAYGGGTMVEPPAFVDAANPGPSAHGLRLKAKPSLEAWVLPAQMPDMQGKLAVPGAAYVGAYYTQP